MSFPLECDSTFAVQVDPLAAKITLKGLAGAGSAVSGTTR